MRAFLCLAVLAAAPCALADFVGRVVHVSDGDTLTVLVDRKQVRVRLDSIDAPELGQPFGKRSQQSLAELCGAKAAHVVDKGPDRYGRIIGSIVCGGVDANAEQVRRGMAWVFVRYAPADSPLYALQGDARWTRRGLWADPQPIAPWDWRVKSREESSGLSRRPGYRG
jgi:endonuclease YncB( thermonuclease family)